MNWVLLKFWRQGAHDRMPFHEGGPMEEEAATLLLQLQFLKGHLTLKGVGK